ncbi:hypothetical protein BJ875DRAFT_337678, partial [Amylocarpus encephaloides]
VEGTALHWHEFLGPNTHWNNIVPSVSNGQVLQGTLHSLTHTFRAEIYGTAWSHSHYSSQVAGGILGPFIVYGP